MSDFDPSTAEPVPDSDVQQAPATTQQGTSASVSAANPNVFDPSTAEPVVDNALPPTQATPIPGWTPGNDLSGYQNPVEPLNGGFLHNASASFGNAAADLMDYGIPEAYYQAAHALTGNPVDAQKLALYQQAVAQRKQQEAQYANAPGSTTGGFLANIAATGLMPGGMIPQVAAQLGLSALQPTTADQPRLANVANTAEGIATNPLSYVGLAGKLLGQPFYAPPNDDVSILKSAGVGPLDTSLLTGSPHAAEVKRIIGTLPFSGEPAKAAAIVPSQTTAILKTLGISNPGQASTELSNIEQNSGQTINTVYGRNELHLFDNTPVTTTQRLFNNKTVPQSYGAPDAPIALQDGLNIVQRRAREELGTPDNPINDIIANIKGEAGFPERPYLDDDGTPQTRPATGNSGVIPINVAQAARQQASALARSTSPVERELGGNLAELLDNSLAKQETVPGDADALFGAKQQYQAMLPVRQALNRASKSAQTPQNNVSLTQLNQVLTSPKWQGAAPNNPILNNLKTLSSAGFRVFNQGNVPNSGTPGRMLPFLLGMAADQGTLPKMLGAGIPAGIYGKYAVHGFIPRMLANSPLFNSGLKYANKAGIAASATEANQ